MPKTAKCVFIFRDSSGTGWSEVHYWNTSAESVELGTRLAHMVDEVAPLRALLLSADCFCIGARISYDVPNGVAALSKSFSLQGNLALSGVSPSVSLACKFTDPSNTRNKVTHLRGFWDLVEVNGEYHPEEGAPHDWEAKFNAWKSKLITGQYGWLSRSVANSAEGTVPNYVTGVDGRITFTLTNVVGAALVPGKVVQLRFSRLNAGKSPLNRQLMVEVLTPTTVRTVDPVAAGPFIGQGRYSFRATEFYRYAQLYDVKLGRRQQGRPFGQLPGRGKAKAKY
jgi:hypothetical protein